MTELQDYKTILQKIDISIREINAIYKFKARQRDKLQTGNYLNEELSQQCNRGTSCLLEVNHVAGGPRKVTRSMTDSVKDYILAFRNYLQNLFMLRATFLAYPLYFISSAIEIITKNQGWMVTFLYPLFCNQLSAPISATNCWQN